MRHDRDIEPILDAWLGPGPETMPDSLFQDVLVQVARTPQRRTRRSIVRYPTMLSAFKVPLAASLAALVIGLAVLVSWHSPERLVPGATSPRPSSSPGPSSGSVDALVGSWVGPPRPIADLAPSQHLAQWTIYSNGLFQLDYAGEPLNSRVVAVGPGEVRLTNSADGPEGCERGTVGTYRYTLSDGGREVTLSSIDERCLVREALLTGTWSSLTCQLGAPCRGPLVSGTHRSSIFDPRNGAAETPLARPGGLTYSVPDGWANDWDWLSSLRLVPVEAYEEEIRVAAYPKDVWPDQISVWTRPVAVGLEPTDCSWREDRFAGSTVDGLAGWLGRHPELTASEPVEIELDGHRALVIDIDLAPGAGTRCTKGQGSFVRLFASRDAFGADGRIVGWGDGAWEVDGWDLGSGGFTADGTSDPQRLILVDLDGEPVVILVDSEQAEQQAAWTERAMPVVESFTFPG
jgi:hypothetical protein